MLLPCQDASVDTADQLPSTSRDRPTDRLALNPLQKITTHVAGAGNAKRSCSVLRATKTESDSMKKHAVTRAVHIRVIKRTDSLSCHTRTTHGHVKMKGRS